MHIVNAAVLDEWTLLPDEAVVSHVLEGRVALFELLMRRHHDRLSSIVRAIVRDGAETEDVMQQASWAHRLVAPHSKTAGARSHTVPK